MNYRPYPDVDRALAQLERGRVPTLTTTLRLDTSAVEAALRPFREMAARRTPMVAWVDEHLAPDLRLTDWQRRVLTEVTEPASAPTVATARVDERAVPPGAVRQTLRRWAYAAGHIEGELDGAVDRMYELVARDVRRRVADETATTETRVAHWRPVSLATPCLNCGHPYNWHTSRGACAAQEDACGCRSFDPGQRPEPVDPRRILGAETGPAAGARQDGAQPVTVTAHPTRCWPCMTDDCPGGPHQVDDVPGVACGCGCTTAAGARHDEPDHVCNSVMALGEIDEPLGYYICGICGKPESGAQQ